MVAISTHPVGKGEEARRVKRARRQIDSALRNVPEHFSQRITLSPPYKPSLTKRGALQKLWYATQNELNVHIARWLINDGLSYNTVVTVGFRYLIQRATDSLDATTLTAKTYSTILEASFVLSCILVERLLKEAFEDAYHYPMVNLLHHWQRQEEPLLVTAYNSSHESAKLKALITLRVEQLYHVNIEPMVQFTMSDITPSVRKISNLEDTETVYVFDTDTQTQKNERRVCTVGGPFPKGETLIKKVRSLNNYFNTPQRVERLTKVQRYYGLPE
ncbi:hypothetical protein PC123_g11433 [Phytophthora cactorum]|nr:hypothetical protein PC123_g11433 [Phytophthora cactorum]